jgi:hypothetical protein
MAIVRVMDYSFPVPIDYLVVRSRLAVLFELWPLIVKQEKLSLYRHEGDKGERKYSSYSFLTSALDGVSGQRHAPASIYPRKTTPSTHLIGGSVGLRADLDTQATENILCFGR